MRQSLRDYLEECWNREGFKLYSLHRVAKFPSLVHSWLLLSQNFIAGFNGLSWFILSSRLHPDGPGMYCIFGFKVVIIKSQNK